VQDWLAHHQQLGVQGIHLYVANVDSETQREMFMRGHPGHLKRVRGCHLLLAPLAAGTLCVATAAASR
jgi:hypothetical protein